MQKLVRESEYFLAWLLFWLCGTVAGFIVGAVGGGIVGGILGVAGVDMQAIRIICGGVGFLLGIPVSYAFFRLFVGSMIVKRIEGRIATQPEGYPDACGSGVGE